MSQSQLLLDSLPSPIRPYQWKGVAFLRSSSGALLADEMGLGKTVQTLVAIKDGKRLYHRVLLIAPTSLCLNWQREFEYWAPDLVARRVLGDAEDRAATYRLPIHVLITSYDQVRLDIQNFQSHVRFDLVILDEAQRIKNVSSATSLACRLIQREHSWALSGTPLENRPEDLMAIFRFVSPQLLKPGMSLRQMHSAMAKHFLRRTKVDVLPDLPPIMIRDIHLELGPSQRAIYDDLWNSRREILQTQDGPPPLTNMLALLTRLKQVCNYETRSQDSVKLEVLRSLLESVEATSAKVLIFSQYVDTLTWLSQRLDIPHAIFHGALTMEAREEMISAFRRSQGPRALLISLRAGGVGLNLQEASTVILFDRWWNPAIEEQAIQRAHRFGRRTPLEVIRFTVEDTVEQRIVEILEAKRTLFRDYVEAIPPHSSARPPKEHIKFILDV